MTTPHPDPVARALLACRSELPAFSDAAMAAIEETIGIAIDRKRLRDDLRLGFARKNIIDALATAQTPAEARDSEAALRKKLDKAAKALTSDDDAELVKLLHRRAALAGSYAATLGKLAQTRSVVATSIPTPPHAAPGNAGMKWLMCDWLPQVYERHAGKKCPHHIESAGYRFICSVLQQSGERAASPESVHRAIDRFRQQ